MNEAKFYDTRKLAISDLAHLKKPLKIGEFYDHNNNNITHNYNIGV